MLLLSLAIFSACISALPNTTVCTFLPNPSPNITTNAPQKSKWRYTRVNLYQELIEDRARQKWCLLEFFDSHKKKKGLQCVAVHLPLQSFSSWKEMITTNLTRSYDDNTPITDEHRIVHGYLGVKNMQDNGGDEDYFTMRWAVIYVDDRESDWLFFTYKSKVMSWYTWVDMKGGGRAKCSRTNWWVDNGRDRWTTKCTSQCNK
ncbi:hypothetical protein CC86DRAFT_402210 [Ophiobolus disseminans]|uniref:Uncharacterized protein n=1 Tax=Ophiobolus disseminans TaxID=1469910 RepID=A0A6A7AEW7_9PLEO|nr:hypothetical protein CC86DRAFT_402210 [Ophiobolus disseminans]